MQVARTLDELDAHRRETGADPAFVPTMGALHAGHLSLIRMAATTGRPVLVSVFVNPTQFGPGDDFDRYPRTLDSDCAAATSAGADLIFAPDADVVYPSGDTLDTPPLPPAATEPRLEDAQRPGHFDGVCQVVARLFDLVRPAYAVFGEKDYQQLIVVRQMVRQQRPRWGELEILAHETVREPDGLALSSRNAYLTPGQREQALGLSRAVAAAGSVTDHPSAERRMREILDTHGIDTDYAVIRDAATLIPLESPGRAARALIAARVGEIRLIDNMTFSASSGPAVQ